MYKISLKHLTIYKDTRTKQEAKNMSFIFINEKKKYFFWLQKNCAPAETREIL